MAAEPNYLEILYKDLALALGDAIWAFARAILEPARNLGTDCLKYANGV